jgi:hypothetical protein
MPSRFRESSEYEVIRTTLGFKRQIVDAFEEWCEMSNGEMKNWRPDRQ